MWSCPTLCDRIDGSPPGSPVPGILQARTLEWVPFSSPGDLPDPGIKPRSPALQADPLPVEPPGKPSLPFYLAPVPTFFTLHPSLSPGVDYY